MTHVSLNLEECLQYELNSYALSMFDEDGLIRLSSKADLAKYLLTSNEAAVGNFEGLPKPCKIFLDGGALLYRVGWKKGTIFKSVIDGYTAFLNSMFPDEQVYVAFDGYDSHSTNDHTHAKRQPMSSLPMQILLSNVLNCKKEVLLSNSSNKQACIKLLANSLTADGHNVEMMLTSL